MMPNHLARRLCWLQAVRRPLMIFANSKSDCYAHPHGRQLKPLWLCWGKISFQKRFEIRDWNPSKEVRRVVSQAAEFLAFQTVYLITDNRDLLADTVASIFLWSAPVAFRRVAIDTPRGPAGIRTTTGSLSALKTNAIPTELSGRLADTVASTPELSHWPMVAAWWKDFFSVQRRMAFARSFNMFPIMLHVRLIN